MNWRIVNKETNAHTCFHEGDYFYDERVGVRFIVRYYGGFLAVDYHGSTCNNSKSLEALMSSYKNPKLVFPAGLDTNGDMIFKYQ